MKISCYSERILNPFRGVMNVISTGDADAVTIDGVNWDLYVHDHFDCTADQPEEFTQIDMPDIRYGKWNRETGFVRAPALPSYHYEKIQQIGSTLFKVLLKHANQIPFAFKDNYELWLLDKENNEPLALLDSVCSNQEIHDPCTLTWKSGIRCQKFFSSQILPAIREHETHADMLNEIVNSRAGNQPGAQWFYRKCNGYGIGLNAINIDEKYIGRELSPRLFPRMFVEQNWNCKSTSALFNDFIEWLSPWLLLLDFLKDNQRKSLEATARKQALLVDEMHLLYPKVISEKDINAARVEAAIRKAASKPDEQTDTIKALNYCYIET